jgi:hypothetical protein
MEMEVKSMSDGYLNTVRIFDAETVAAGDNAESDALDLNKFRPEGYFSLQVELTGTGTAKIEYLLSNNGDDYLEPSEGADIVLAHTAASGPGADGKDIYVFEPEVARFLKIKVSETGSANPVIVTITLAVQ